MNSKADYVRSQPQTRKHECHWSEAELIKFSAAVIALVQDRYAALTPGCFWEQDGEMWTSSCGAAYQFTDGGPAENDHKLPWR